MNRNVITCDKCKDEINIKSHYYKITLKSGSGILCCGKETDCDFCSYRCLTAYFEKKHHDG